jgi:hypothetical protein
LIRKRFSSLQKKSGLHDYRGAAHNDVAQRGVMRG